MRRMRRAFPSISGLFLLVVFLCLVVGLAGWLAIGIPQKTAEIYGPPSATLPFEQRWLNGAKLLWKSQALTEPVGGPQTQQAFQIVMGEPVGSIASRLQKAGLISDADAFRTYLIYSGADTRLQAGTYELDPSMTALAIAQELQDATPEEVDFGVLPGWRLEEIAAALPSSGLQVSPDAFIQAAHNPDNAPALRADIPAGKSLEGFLFPGTYTFKREATAADMLQAMTDRFEQEITPELRQAFKAEGISLYQAVTLASVVQREAVVTEEQPAIAGVFFNRLVAGMKLESDPTVQYALGYNQSQRTWWTNPLDAADLGIDSPYNTYQYAGYPPGPIANPSLAALRAVAFPDESPYYYFRARCDGSGRHNFSATYEEHLKNACQ